jgi:hypothetical protein
MEQAVRLSVLAFGLVLAIACSRKESADSASQGATSEAEPAAQAERRDSTAAYEHQTHGALQVMSVGASSPHWFQVFKDGKLAYEGNPKLLNSSVELAPGEYMVDVNRTQRPVTIEAGKKTIIWTGELLVDGGPSGAYWYPMEGTERRVTSNPPLVGSPLPLFAGTYVPFVHVTVSKADTNLGPATVTAGRRTTLKH